jgi:hypothetical protein
MGRPQGSMVVCKGERIDRRVQAALRERCAPPGLDSYGVTWNTVPRLSAPPKPVVPSRLPRGLRITPL